MFGEMAELAQATLADLTDLQQLAMTTLSQEIQDPNSLTYLLREEGQGIGYLKVNWGPSQTEQELENGFEIQRIYLLQSHQGKGYGKLLFDYVLELASQSGQEWVWLGVWEHNYKAQRFYANYGFEKFAEHSFPVGDKVDVDWLLKRRIDR